jgi:hypothetical protein
MHPRLGELLDLRDGDGTADVARHVRLCRQCAEELAELRATAVALRALPEMDVGEDQWPIVVDRIVRRRRRSWLFRGATAAAGVLAVLSAVVVVRVAPPNEVVSPPSDADARLAVEQLASASQELELVLQNPSLHSQVLSPRRAATIVEIEDRIALVDLALAENVGDSPDELAVVLWSDRVELLDALVEARTARPRGDSIVFAEHPFEGSIR